jgi:thiamine-phosphate pyrophosphorylase
VSALLDERLRRLRATRVYVILTLGPEGDDAKWRPAAERALATGCVGMLQLRDVGGDEDRLAARARDLAPRCAEHGALFLVNDRPDLAAALDADGAHVGQEDVPAAQARALVGPNRLLGLSTHGPEEMEAARALRVDYAGLGPCFPTVTKALVREPRGPALVASCLAAAGDLPFFPIGGITPANAASLVAAGARRVAVGAGVLAAADPAAAVRALDGLLRAPRS